MAASIVFRGAHPLRLNWLFPGLLAFATGVANAAGGGGGGGGTPGIVCLNENPDKVCLTVTASPNPVMPNGQLQLTASMSSVLKASSSRNATLTMTFSPSTTVTAISPGPEMTCNTAPAATVTCSTDKLGFTQTDPRTVTVTLTAPPSGNLVSTAVFGWKGRTGTVTTTTPTSSSGAQAQSTMITEVGGFAQVNYLTVTDARPVGGRIDVDPEPGRPPFVLTVSIIDNGPDVDANGSCVLGVASLAPLFFCVDSAPAGNPRRWLKADFGTSETLLPTHVTKQNHDVLVSALQLTPDFPLPVGVFVTNFNGTSYDPEQGVTVRCSSNPTPPCIELVQDLGGSWSTRVKIMVPPAFPPTGQAPLDRLYALMNFVVNPVAAGGIRPPSLVK